MTAQTSTTASGKRLVFVVEDDEFMRGLEVKSLETAGFNISTASDGKKALALLLKGPKPDLIILDLLLPDMSGFDVLAQIKQDPLSSSIPILVLSNLGQEEEIDRAMKLGAASYLIKANCTFSTIIAKVQEIVG
ncbi:MAG TPA: response regulator [Candidatus Paceibacterota bacterium]